MADPITSQLSGMNPFTNFNIGIGTFGNIALILLVTIMIMALIGLLVFFFAVKKSYSIRIPVYKLIGNTPTRVNTFFAKEVPFGMAGDKLWRIAPKGFAMPFKIIKWLPVGKYQSAPNEFSYWIRQDGEWINFSFTNIDEKSGNMGIKFVQEDMRLQRLATEKLLEQRLLNKGFWEKYGLIIGYVFFFLVITICMIIIFYQFSKIIEKLSGLVGVLVTALEKTNAPSSLIPV